jgi:hypothetical protein
MLLAHNLHLLSALADIRFKLCDLILKFSHLLATQISQIIELLLQLSDLPLLL